jgi:hypothetical protein
MKLRQVTLMLAAFGTGGLSILPASVTDTNIQQYGVGKTHGYTQSGPGTPTPTSYGFNAFVDATTNGVVNSAKVYGPLCGYFDTNGPQDLIFRGNNDGADFSVTGYLNTGALNTDFPNDNSGNYKLKIDTGTPGGSEGGYDHVIQFNLGGDAYPTTIPTLTLDNGSWISGIYTVAATDHDTHFGWTFSDYNSSTDVVLFSIYATNGGGSDVVRVQFNGSNPGGYTVSANLLQAGVDYTGELVFARIVDMPDDISNATGVAYYSMETKFSLQARRSRSPQPTL